MFRKLIILLLAAGCSFAVTTKQIDDIRAASSLSDEDAQTLAAFIDQQFDEMLLRSSEGYGPANSEKAQRGAGAV